MARPSTPLRVARLLSTNQVVLQARQHVVHCADKPVLKYATLPDPHAWKPLGQAMLENQRHCACAYLQRQHDLLQNNVHLVLRHPWQWGLVISKLPSYLMGSNARYKVLHCPTSLEPAMQRLQNSLQKKLTLQCANRPSDRSSGDTPVMQPEQAIDTLQELSTLVTEEAHWRAREAPNLQAEVARQAQLEMRCLQIATGQFDKKLTRLWGVCSTLHEARILRDSLLGDRFLVWGWAASPAMAKAVALFQIVDKSTNRGVVPHALEARMGRAFLRSKATFLQWPGEVLPRKAEHGATPPPWDVAPPSFFNVLKWKSQECHPETPLLKWRDVISFLKHPFRGWGRLVGRALQLVVLEVAGQVFSFGFQNMLGARDQIMAATRLVGREGDMRCLEHDMVDMYWEVPKDEMLQSLTWAPDLLSKGKTELFFSLAKGGLNELDRVGTASSDHFMVITGRQVKFYVEFELFDNCFFTMGPLIMLQGTTSIPIGGLLS